MWLCNLLNAHYCTCRILIWEPELNTRQMVFISCDNDNGAAAMTCPKTQVSAIMNDWIHTIVIHLHIVMMLY